MKATRTCSIDECSRPMWARGWCGTHYRRWATTGHPLTPSCRDDWFSKFLRFLPSDVAPNECWLWRGPVGSKGYGNLQIREDVWSAHRLSYAMHHGDLPADRFICHHCDNPPCVNPAHLYAGTPQDNINDKVARGRLADPLPGELNPNAKLTAAQVAAIRERIALGSTQRAVGREFGIAQSHVGRIVRREAWL